MATFARRAARAPFAPVVAAMFGVAAAVLVAAAPMPLLERVVSDSGLAAASGLAQPPLGLAARLVLAVLAFVAVAGALAIALTPLSRWLERDRRLRTPWHGAADAAIDAEVSPVATRRRPIFAPAELGAPLMSDAAITSLAPPAEPVAEAPRDRAPDDVPIAALIARLETGLARRAANGPDPLSETVLPLQHDWIVAEPDAAADDGDDTAHLHAALGALRKLATG